MALNLLKVKFISIKNALIQVHFLLKIDNEEKKKATEFSVAL